MGTLSNSTSIAPIIRLFIGKPCIGCIFAYQYQIGTMTDKVADTDI